MCIWKCLTWGRVFRCQWVGRCSRLSCNTTDLFGRSTRVGVICYMCIWKLPGVVFAVARQWVGVRAVEIPKGQRCCSLVTTFVTHRCHQEIMCAKPLHTGILWGLAEKHWNCESFTLKRCRQCPRISEYHEHLLNDWKTCTGVIEGALRPKAADDEGHPRCHAETWVT